MRLNVRDGWWGDLPVDLPPGAEAVGYAWMVRTRALDVMPHARWSFTARVGARQSFEFQGLIYETFPVSYAPQSLAEQLEFALKYDGVNLEILRAFCAGLRVDEVEAMEAWVRSAPTSTYARRAWYLYELLTGRILALDDTTAGAYVALLDPDRYFVGAEQRVRRQRVVDNLFGGRDFCAIVRRTATLDRLAAQRLDRRIVELLGQHDAETLARVVSYLYTKETRSSYEIERERPSTDKVKHFVAALKQAHDWPSLALGDLLRLQNLIVTDPRNRATDWRDHQNYVGGPGPRDIAYVSPRPEDLPLLMAGWLQMLGRLVDADVDAVVAAAAASFAFVYLHPFEDGNGRIHRFLVHFVLARKRFTPPGAMVPVSAAMLARMKEYDAALERFSEPLMVRVRYELDADFAIEVLHDTSGYYRYPDLTAQAEALYGWVASTIEVDVPKELSFLLAWREAREQVARVVELPDRHLDQFVTRCMEQGGRLSRKRCGKDFDLLSDDEVARMEAAVRAAMTAHGMEVAS